MKIISKFKDYYDFVVGEYGIDPLIVYERRCRKNYEPCGVITMNRLSFIDEKRLLFHICGSVYPSVWYRGKLFISKNDLLDLYNTLPNTKYGLSAFKYYIQDILRHYHGVNIGKEYPWSWNVFRKEKQVNDLFSCPIIIEEYSNNVDKNYYYNPKLDSFGFASVIPANEMFLLLAQFLAKKDIDMPSDPTDMGRFLSRGFDKKTSFRNM